MRLSVLNARKGVLQLILPLLRLLPPRTASRVVAGLGEAEFLINGRLRDHFCTALRRASRYFGCEWDVRAVGKHLAGNHLRWRARDLLLDGLPNESAACMFHVEGREILDTALAKERGVLLLFNHFGACLMPAHWLVREGYPLRWFTERPRHISKLIERSFQTEGPLGQAKLFMSRGAGPAEGGTAIRHAVRMLRAGLIVQVAGDVRWRGSRTVPASFLGQRYTFTTTWITLAAKTGAPVVPTFASMDKDGTYRIEFLPAFEIPPEAAETGAGLRWVQAYMESIEARVRRDPENSSDYFFWNDSPEYFAESA